MVDTLTFGNGTFPWGVAVSPDGETVYVTNESAYTIGSVSVIETASRAVTGTITVGVSPRGVAVSPEDGGAVYVVNRGSNTVSVLTETVPPATVPGAPTGVTPAAGNGQVGLSWSAPLSDGGSGVIDYVVEYRASSSGTWLTFADGISPATSATVTGLVNGTPYDFRVSAVNAAGTGDPSATATSTPVTVPGAPTGVTPAAGNGQVGLSWSAPLSDGGSGVIDYVVEYRASSSGTWLTFADGISPATSATVTGLVNGTEYDFRVSTVNAVDTGGPSVPVRATPVTVPGAPTGLTPTAGDSEVPLSWTAPVSDGGSGVIDYVVEYRASSSSTWSTFADGVSPTASVTVTGLVNGTPYDFRVSTVNAVGTGDPSALVSATPVARIGPPSATVGASATAGDASASVSWSVPVSDGSSPITEYVVTPINGTDPGALIVPITVTGATTTAIVPGLVNGDSYRFVVAAVNANGAGPDSDPSNPVTPSSSGPSLPIAVLMLDRTELAPGQAFTATATNLLPDTLYTFVMNSTPVVLGSAFSSGSGALVFPTQVPAGVITGSHTISVHFGGAATATVATATASVAVTVSGLATAGSEIGGPLTLAGLLLAAGLGVLVPRVRRRAVPSSRTGASRPASSP